MENNYECMFILKDDITPEEKEEVAGKVSKKIEASGGKIISSKVFIKERSFAYCLKSRGAEKKKYSKGTYWLVQFSISADKLSDLKETMRLEERILRNLILRREDSAS